jgi:hypothetical protein
MTSDFDRSALSIDSAFHKTIDRFDKVVAVKLRVKSEDGAAQ